MKFANGYSSHKFEATNSVFSITDKNTSFSNSSPSYWIPVSVEELINKLKKLLEVRSQNDIELHGKNFEKRGTRIEIGNSGYNLAGFDHSKSETLVELGRIKIKISTIWSIERKQPMTIS